MTLATVGLQVPVMNGVATILPDADYETYSEAGYAWNEAAQKWEGIRYSGKTKRGLTVVGTYNYVLHPTFEPLSLAYNLKDGIGARIWRPGQSDPTDLFDWIKSYDPNSAYQGLLESWNNFFEVTVWNLYCVPKLGWPPLYLDQMRDCMAKAALAGYPRKLDDAGVPLKLVNLKDKAGHDLIRTLTVPKNPTKKSPTKRWTRETAPEDFARFDAYNIGDIVAEGEASSKLPDLPPRELKNWQVDQRVNHRGMQLDTKFIYDAIAVIEQAKSKYNAELFTLTNGAVKSFTEVKPTTVWLRTQGVYVDGLDEDVVTEELEKNHSYAVKRVLQIRATLSFGSVKKLYAMACQVGPDGRLRDQHAFAAAHTHLWNGQGVQMLNLVKGKFNKPEQIDFALGVLGSRSLDYVEGVFANGPPWDKKDNDKMEALEVITHCLRSVVVARPGTRLISSDYSAIQAVVTAALAGEKWQLDVFHENKSVYLETASMLTGTSVADYERYRKENDKHHPDRQFYGKIPTLANGFGAWVGGWRKLDKEGLLKDKSDEEVKALIMRMRARCPMTTNLWGGQTINRFTREEREELYGLEGAVVKAIKDPGTAYGYRGVWYQVYKDVLYCQPPGRECSPLVYHEPRLEPTKTEWKRPWELDITYLGWNSNQAKKGKSGWVRMALYGGVLTQNIVAKIAREFQADSLVALEETGIYLPVLHCHDEIVTEVADGQGDLAEYLAIVNRTQRPWAVDDWGRPWPIKAPGAEETYRYGKWE